MGGDRLGYPIVCPAGHLWSSYRRSERGKTMACDFHAQESAHAERVES